MDYQICIVSSLWVLGPWSWTVEALAARCGAGRRRGRLISMALDGCLGLEAVPVFLQGIAIDRYECASYADVLDALTAFTVSQRQYAPSLGHGFTESFTNLEVT
jgi:hypothetical protein